MNLYIWLGSLLSGQWLKPFGVPIVFPFDIVYSWFYIYHTFLTFTIFTDLAKILRNVQPAHSYKIRVGSVIDVSTKNEGEYGLVTNTHVFLLPCKVQLPALTSEVEGYSKVFVSEDSPFKICVLLHILILIKFLKKQLQINLVFMS